MKKLDVVRSLFKNGQTMLVWHRYNTEDNNNDAVGLWPVFGEMTSEAILIYAKQHCDADIEVAVL